MNNLVKTLTTEQVVGIIKFHDVDRKLSYWYDLDNPQFILRFLNSCIQEISTILYWQHQSKGTLNEYYKIFEPLYYSSEHLVSVNKFDFEFLHNSSEFRNYFYTLDKLHSNGLLEYTHNLFRGKYIRLFIDEHNILYIN